MNEIISKIQAVRNTLEGFEIISKKDTMLKLIGCQQVLDEIIEALRNPPAENTEVQDGNDHAE